MQRPKYFRRWQPHQTNFQPPSARERLADDLQEYILHDLVDELDHYKILDPSQANNPSGEKWFDLWM